MQEIISKSDLVYIRWCPIIAIILPMPMKTTLNLLLKQFSRSVGGVNLGWGGSGSLGGKTLSEQLLMSLELLDGRTDVNPTRTLFNDSY
jgi:hypothetical protein